MTSEAKLCTHCHRPCKSRCRRGLCGRCASRPHIKVLYPSTSIYSASAAVRMLYWPRCQVCGGPVATIDAHQPICSTCQRPEPLRSKIFANIARYRARAENDEPLFAEA